MHKCLMLLVTISCSWLERDLPKVGKLERALNCDLYLYCISSVLQMQHIEVAGRSCPYWNVGTLGSA